MGMFDKYARKMGETNAAGSGCYFEEGDYIVRVRRHQAGSHATDGTFVAIEGEVLAVLRAFPARPSWVDGSPVKASLSVGDVGVQILMLDKHKPAIANAKNFLLTVSGRSESALVASYCETNKCPPSEVATAAAWGELMDLAFGGTGEVYAGTVLRCRAEQRRAKTTGKPFTRVVWDVAPEGWEGMVPVVVRPDADADSGDED